MNLKNIVEALIFSADQPLSLSKIQSVFADEHGQCPEKSSIQTALTEIAVDYQQRPVQLKQVASGYRFQVKEEFSPWITRLLEERPPRYSRALLETIAIIAYQQPMTRGEIEAIRGVSVNTQIIKTLMEREWVKIVGHKDVPGRPALYVTTQQFLDYFNLKSLSELPTLKELQAEEDIDLYAPQSENALNPPQSPINPNQSNHEQEKPPTAIDEQTIEG